MTTQRPKTLEHDSAEDATKAKGKLPGAMNKGAPRKALNKVMKAKAPDKPPAKYPWGDKWIHPDNPALYDGDVDPDDF